MKIKLKPFDIIKKDFGYKNIGNVWRSSICSPSINNKMIKYFGTELEVQKGNIYGDIFRIPSTTNAHWTFNNKWIEKDIFKCSEIDNLFEEIIKNI